MSDGLFRIEKKIPIPAGRCVRTPFPFLDMNVGDSFLVPCKPDEFKRIRNRIWMQAKAFARREPEARFRVTIRFVEGGARCWRVPATGA